MKVNEGTKIKISVRNLVEFVLRSGDIDNRRLGAQEKEAMQAGARLHRKIQKKMGPDYKAEVAMKHWVRDDQLEILVEGRADGVFMKDGWVIIDEIKGMYLDVSQLEQPFFVHLAQVKCYAYFYCEDQELEQVKVQVTYCNLETEEIKRFVEEQHYTELKQWFDCLIHDYMKWAMYLYHHGLRRDASLKQLEFPFPYREGQRDLAVSVYRTICRQKKLFIQAPTGIGKTLSTLFPALKAMGEGYGDKLFYLTAKTITGSVAQEALAILEERGLFFKYVTITSKEKLCILEKPECNPDACPYAKGHFDRINEAVYEIIHQGPGITREMIVTYADKHQVCPYEFCLDISNWMDAIICDYNYVFDPNVKLRRYFGDGVEGSYLFLIDEAHNLVPRAREMYSSTLYKEDFLLIKKLVDQKSPKLTKICNQCNHILLEWKRQCEGYQVLQEVNHLALAVMTLFGELERFLEQYREFEGREQILDFYFSLRDFLWCHDRLDEHYQIYTELLPQGTLMVKLLCVNPSANLKQCFDKGNSVIFFSATLLPIGYYKELLSNHQQDYAVYVPSPFPANHRLLLVARDVTSRYTRRNRGEYEKILAYLCHLAKTRAGNYMVFFPSYQYMEAVKAVYDQHECAAELFRCILQDNRMSEGEREAFLLQFDSQRKGSLFAFCVMGGLFSEGVDLKAERLIGTVIVGTGLPMVCTEQEILKSYFDQKQQNGFDFAYQYPGMNKVMQAAGRVIRTAMDKGVILLMDDRFLRADYQSMFPREWQDFKVVTERQIETELRLFWDQW